MCARESVRVDSAGECSSEHLPAEQAGSASLDGLETNGVDAGEYVAGGFELERAVHGSKQLERLKIASALSAVPDAPWRGRVQRMLGCCSNPAVGVSAGGAVAAVWYRCRDRLCPTCARWRARETECRVLRAIDGADSLRFITLTVRSDGRPLAAQLDDLYRWFRALRARPEWKAHVRGAVATVEVTWSRRRQQWHPHLHVLADGSYWAQAEISAVWADVTGGSPIVDIRAIHGRRAAARYVAKYAGKPADMSGWRHDQIQDYAAAMHRRRAVITCGSMHGHRAPDRDSQPEASVPRTHQVPLHEVERRARRGCRDAQTVLAALAARTPTYARAVERRGAAAPPLGILCRRTLRESRAAMRRLAAAWTARHLGGWWSSTPTAELARPEPSPPRPPPGPRMRDHTQPLADWHARDTNKL